MTGDKFRFRFAKTGSVRLLSHHDLMRTSERMLRRAALPFRYTEGFRPGPRIVFALSLPLGVEGLDEVVEIEFTQPLDGATVLAKLAAQSPQGLSFTRFSAVSMKATARPRRIVYRLPLPAHRQSAAVDRCADRMSAEKIWVDRLKPAPKQLNIRPYLRDLRVAEGGLLLDLWVTQTGTARVDELLSLLDVADLSSEGAVVQRIMVELRDEVPGADPTDQPPDGPADTLPLDPVAAAALAQREEEKSTAARWGLSPSGPVVE